jgi:hypothetical protein
MKLKGILDFSLGNFLCLRGFAPMGELSLHSKADESYQRKIIDPQEQSIKNFLEKGDYTFFPELILGASLEDLGATGEQVGSLYERLKNGEGFSRTVFGDLGISVYVIKTKGDDARAPKLHMTATLDGFDSTLALSKIYRIDGNHRLEAAAKAKPEVKAYKTPFCLVFFRTNAERNEFSRVFFHNINFKAVALTMEQNLRLILEDENIFPDDALKEPEPFGWPYYHARKLHGKLDLELLPNLIPFFKDEPRTFLLRQFEFLIARGVLGDNENAIKRLKEALGKVNGLFYVYPALKDSKNQGFLAALVYYELHKSSSVLSFVRWVLNNHLHLIKESSSSDLIAIFDKILESRKRTIFVSMPFGKPKPDDHYAIIQRIAKEVSEAEPVLNPPLKVERVDWFQDGTSYEINDKIIEMISDCGLLIGNLTHYNPNVYHEIGFVMGKAKAEGKEVANMLLFLDESVAEENDKVVGFNLQSVMQLRFKQPELEFVPKLRENLERFFKNKP